MIQTYKNRLVDPTYLRSEQYKTPANLDARIQLHECFSTNSYPWPRWVLDRLQVPPGSQFLEIGCGPGYLWQQNLDRLPPDWKLVLADFSPGMLQQAQDNLRVKDSQCQFALADARWLPWREESFEVVIANHMLYHVPDRPQALAEIYRVLKPGGKFYAATNGSDHLVEIFALMQQIDPEIEARAPIQFGLENGGEQLAAFFPKVSLHHYNNDLRVTEVEPLLAYIFSFQRSSQLEQNVERLVNIVEAQMAAQGAIHITKSTGLFEAEKPSA